MKNVGMKIGNFLKKAFLMGIAIIVELFKKKAEAGE